LSRNFGWGSRDMQDAGRMALESTSASFSTVASHTEKFGQFKSFAKEEHGIGRMERITPELVIEYGRELAGKVDAGQLEPSYAQNLVSSINSVMKAATRGEWKSVSPTKDCKIPQRDNVRATPTPGREKAQNTINEMKGQGNERVAAIAQLAMDLGLRSKEASLLNAEKALSQAEKTGYVSVTDGTKGGREREIPITSERQIQTLKSAAAAQNSARAVMPPEQNWKQFRAGELRDAREKLAESTSSRGIHGLRATYAAERYEALTGHPAPCNGGEITDRQSDMSAREQIAAELGHGRIDVLVSYIGGRS